MTYDVEIPGLSLEQAHICNGVTVVVYVANNTYNLVHSYLLYQFYSHPIKYKLSYPPYKSMFICFTHFFFKYNCIIRTAQLQAMDLFMLFQLCSLLNMLPCLRNVEHNKNVVLLLKKTNDRATWTLLKTGDGLNYSEGVSSPPHICHSSVLLLLQTRW